MCWNILFKTDLKHPGDLQTVTWVSFFFLHLTHVLFSVPIRVSFIKTSSLLLLGPFVSLEGRRSRWSVRVKNNHFFNPVSRYGMLKPTPYFFFSGFMLFALFLSEDKAHNLLLFFQLVCSHVTKTQKRRCWLRNIFKLVACPGLCLRHIGLTQFSDLHVLSRTVSLPEPQSRMRWIDRQWKAQPHCWSAVTLN